METLQHYNQFNIFTEDTDYHGDGDDADVWGAQSIRLGSQNCIREKFLSRDPPPLCIIQVIKLFRCRNLHLRLALQSPSLLQSEIEWRSKMVESHLREEYLRFKIKSKVCRIPWFIGLAGKTCPKTMQCNAAGLFPIAKVNTFKSETWHFNVLKSNCVMSKSEPTESQRS